MWDVGMECKMCDVGLGKMYAESRMWEMESGIRKVGSEMWDVES